MSLAICPCGEVWGMDELKAEKRFKEFASGINALGEEINETSRLGVLVRDIIRNAFLAGYKVGHLEGGAEATTKKTELEFPESQTRGFSSPV